MSLPSPILIYGDVFLSRNNLSAIKKKYPKYKWVTMSADTASPDDIRMEAGISSWDDSTKVVLINDIPNRKQVREFIVDLAKTVPDGSKLVVWDSKRHIKHDPKTKTIGKTWSDFVTSFGRITGSKVINNGDELGEKEQTDCVTLVQQQFAKYKKTIDYEVAKLVVNIVGYNRGLLLSDVDKMALSTPDTVTTEFIIENAFPTSNEAILYKFGNILDTCSYENSILTVEKFVDAGINQNVLAEVIAKKARWQMAACCLWASGMAWNQVNNRLMEMGKFPSVIWHHGDLRTPEKKKHSVAFGTLDTAREFLVRKMGFPLHCFKPKVVKAVKPTKRRRKTPAKPAAETDKPKRGECIPLPFMADQLTSFIEAKIVRVNKKKIDNPDELKAKIRSRSIQVYLKTQEGLARVRYGNNQHQDLYDMVRAIVDVHV